MEPKMLGEPLFPPLPPLTEAEAQQNAMQYERERREGKLPFIGFIRFCCVVGCIGLGLIAYDRFTQKPFDSVEWKRAAKEFRHSDRSAMVNDLVSREKLIGLSHSQMISLLGKPEHEPFRGWDAGYEMGGATMSIDVQMLILKFDAQQRITDYEIVAVD